MPFTKMGDEELDASITFRCMKREKVELEEQAKDVYGLSASALARRRVFQRPTRAKSDETMLKELRRQGGQLKLLRMEHPATFDEDVCRCLQALERCAEELTEQFMRRRTADDMQKGW